jgi:septal ring factor EnvC (AmiA/AmiB activator)
MGHSKRSVLILAASLIASCADRQLEPRVSNLENSLKSTQNELAKCRESNQELASRIAYLEQAVTDTTAAKPEPMADPAELAAANNLFTDSIQSFCRESSMLDKVAEAQCMEKQVAALQKLLRGRPLGVGVTAAAFGIVRVKCAKAFPRELHMRALCEDQEIQKIAP